MQDHRGNHCRRGRRGHRGRYSGEDDKTMTEERPLGMLMDQLQRPSLVPVSPKLQPREGLVSGKVQKYVSFLPRSLVLKKAQCVKVA